MLVRAARYAVEASKALKRHADVAARIREKIRQYADHPAALANNVAMLADPPYKRLRVEDFRVIFEELEGEVIIIRIGPRSGVYE